MKYIIALSGLAALWLVSAMEHRLAGAWADWCLLGILLWWTSLWLGCRRAERRAKKKSAGAGTPNGQYVNEIDTINIA